MLKREEKINFLQSINKIADNLEKITKEGIKMKNQTLSEFRVESAQKLSLLKEPTERLQEILTRFFETSHKIYDLRIKEILSLITKINEIIKGGDSNGS